jgi:hypothetical protein
MLTATKMKCMSVTGESDKIHYIVYGTRCVPRVCLLNHLGVRTRHRRVALLVGCVPWKNMFFHAKLLCDETRLE